VQHCNNSGCRKLFKRVAALHINRVLPTEHEALLGTPKGALTMKPLQIAVALTVALALPGCGGALPALQWRQSAFLTDSALAGARPTALPESCIAPQPVVPTARNIGNAPPVSDSLFGDEQC
jgi:hypothetical protein